MSEVVQKSPGSVRENVVPCPGCPPKERSRAISKELVPRLVAWESTRACGLACLHCRAEAQPKPHPDQLRKEEVLRLIDEIAAFSRPILIITGGDPLLRKDVFEVSAYAEKKGLRPVMSPSGSRVTPQIIQRMIDSGIQRISMSLDGSRAEIHDYFRQVKGCFEETLQALEWARQANLPFQINTTVAVHNQEDLPAIKDLAISLGAMAWDVFLFVPIGRGSRELALSPQQYEEIMIALYEASKSSPIPIKMTCSPQYQRVLRQLGGGGKGRAAGRACMAGNGFCFVSHTGEVLGCGYLPLPAGNIRQHGFQEIYQRSDLFERLRDPSLLKGKCRYCEFKGLCGGCRARALAISGDVLAEEPYCLYNPRN